MMSHLGGAAKKSPGCFFKYFLQIYYDKGDRGAWRFFKILIRNRVRSTMGGSIKLIFFGKFILIKGVGQK